MKRAVLSLIVWIFLAVTRAPANAQVPESCELLYPARNQSLVLERSGSYCLGADVLIDNGSPFVSHRRDRPYFSAQILESGISLDLQGHSVTSGDITNGVSISSESGWPPNRITIRNGSIRSLTWGINSGYVNAAVSSDLGDPLAGISKIGKTPEQLERWTEDFRELHEAIFNKELRQRPKAPSEYQRREIHLEDLHIYARGIPEGNNAGGGAINVQGDGTVIRNCVIETDDGNAIWIFGPNSIIENNVIIVHGKNRLREADAPIRLIQGDGAVIRNNKIVLRDNANKRGISTFDTGPILMENNTFYGMSDKEDVAKAFLGTLSMKESGSKFEPIWKAFFSGTR